MYCIQVARHEGGLTLKYKVSFSGFAYVEADSPEEAEEKAMYEDDAVYEEKKCESVEEVDEFVLRKIRSMNLSTV